MRNIVIAGNWKMYKSNSEAKELVEELKNKTNDIIKTKMIVCPPFTALSMAAEMVKGTNIQVGAQNMYWEEAGAFTGEVSPLMLNQLDVEYVIIGHSERRQFFGETDETVNRRIKAALDHDLKPIFCVGENLEEREAGRTTQVVSSQIKGGLAGVEGDFSNRMVIAYEPIWAIGTGRVAEPEDANEVIRHIRAVVGSTNGPETAQGVRILYGGSVKPDNVQALMEEPEIDGALVGGASLQGDDFLQLIKY